MKKQPTTPLSAAIRVIQNVCGVGCVAAKRLAVKLSDDEQARIVARYAEPEAHDEIRRLVLDKQPQKQRADEPSDAAHDG